MPPPNDFIQDFIFYNSGNMCPIRFHRWAAVATLAMAVGRRVYVEHNYFRIYTDHYICLVGEQGTRKTTAKDIAKAMLLEAIPNYPQGASVMSREKIVERLCDDDITKRTFTDEQGATIDWHPLAFFVNELKNFLSINPQGMIEFLTDIYETKYFASDTIKHGLQPVINPCINILACETPKWIVQNLKTNIISGGFSRRMLFVYEPEEPERITFPSIPPGGVEARRRCVVHLAKIQNISGPFSWDSEATKAKFDTWNRSLPKVEDEVMAGFYRNKDILALRTAMCIALAQPEPKLLLTWELIETAIAFLYTVEEHLPKLTVAAGRNVLSVPTQELLQMLEAKGGEVSEKEFHRVATKQMMESEYMSVKKALKETDQIFIVPKELKYNGSVTRVEVILSPKRWKELVEKKEQEKKDETK